MNGEPGTRGPGCGAPPPGLRLLFAPPPAQSRKVPKRSPNVRKRNFLFPILERAALRWIGVDLGTLLAGSLEPGAEECGKVEWATRRLPPRPPIQLFSFNRPSFSSAPLFPANLLLLKGPRFPSPLRRRAGGSGINPPPHSDFPPSPPPLPRARAAWTLRQSALGGGVPAAPYPSTPSESGLGRGRGRGRGPGAAVQTCFLSPAAAAAWAPVCGCAPRPAHPPRPPARRVGAALKGLGAGLWRLGIGAEKERGEVG